MRKRNYSMILAGLFVLLLTFTHSVQAEDGKMYEVGTDNLNIRTAPDKNAKVIGKLNLGDRVNGFKEQHGWISTYYNGEMVWVASQYLFENKVNVINEQQTKNKHSSNTMSKSIIITEKSVNLRDGPNTNQAIVGHASKGDTYSLVETSNDWHKVKLDNGTIVWVAAWLTNEASGNKTTSSSSDNNSNKTTTTKSSNQSTQPLVGYNIMLDAGHGGIDPGALGINAEKEKDLTLDFTNTVAQKLRNEGATVLLTRSTDSYVSLFDRVRISESYWTDAFISIHFNAFTSNASNGVSTHYYSNGANHELAQYIQNGFEKHTNLKSRGVKKDNYYVLRENSDLSVLVELGFITNPHDLGVIQNSNYSLQVAESISEGLISYFNK